MATTHRAWQQFRNHPHDGSQPDWLSQPQLHYTRSYLWLVGLSGLDLALTSVILNLGGRELNVLADAILQHGGLPWLTLYKFALVTLVIVFCEQVGRRQPRTGDLLAKITVALTSVPVTVALVQLIAYRDSIPA